MKSGNKKPFDYLKERKRIIKGKKKRKYFIIFERVFLMNEKEKKYEFTGNKMNFEGRILREIIYVRDVARLSEGEVGGWIESEANLSKYLFMRVIVVFYKKP